MRYCFCVQLVLFWSINLDVQSEDRWKPRVVLICDPKHVWFSSVFLLGIKTRARDESSHFTQTYEFIILESFVNAYRIHTKHASDLKYDLLLNFPFLLLSLLPFAPWKNTTLKIRAKRNVSCWSITFTVYWSICFKRKKLKERKTTLIKRQSFFNSARLSHLATNNIINEPHVTHFA